MWERNKSLTLRTLHELDKFPTELLNELYSTLSHQERLNLVTTLRDNIFSIPNITLRKSMLIDTVSSVHTAEKDCEIVYNYITLLEEAAYPECLELVGKILDLKNAKQRREKYLAGNYKFELIKVNSGKYSQGNASPIDEGNFLIMMYI